MAQGQSTSTWDRQRAYQVERRVLRKSKRAMLDCPPVLDVLRLDPLEMARRGRSGGLVGGHARAAALPPSKRSEIARAAAAARWGPTAPQRADREAAAIAAKARLTECKRVAMDIRRATELQRLVLQQGRALRSWKVGGGSSRRMSRSLYDRNGDLFIEGRAEIVYTDHPLDALVQREEDHDDFSRGSYRPRAWSVPSHVDGRPCRTIVRVPRGWMRGETRMIEGTLFVTRCCVA